MPLKLTIAELDEIPEAQRSLYRPRQEGGFILDVDGGAVAKATLDEFRNKNVELMKRLQAVRDFDPEELSNLRADNAHLRVDLDRVRKGNASDVDARVKAAEKKAAGIREKLEKVLIDGEVAKAATSIGAHPGALEDVATRVRSRFRLDDEGHALAVDASGNTIYGDDGRPLTVEGAVRQLTVQAPHLFRQSSGGGAAHPSARGGRITHGGQNPWKKETFNATEQARIMKHDRSEAARLAAEAGATLPE
jgi:hypothetical protein